MLHPFLLNISLDICLIQHYSYRTARITDHTVILPRSWVYALESELCRQGIVRSDNHTTFLFKYTGIDGAMHHLTTPDKEMSVCFHDGVAMFGKGIDEGDW